MGCTCQVYQERIAFIDGSARVHSMAASISESGRVHQAARERTPVGPAVRPGGVVQEPPRLVTLAGQGVATEPARSG